MKKAISILFMVFLIAGSFSMQSCKKCTTCTYTYETITGEPATYTYPELCGNNGDINDYKDACVNAASVLTKGNCTCVDD